MTKGKIAKIILIILLIVVGAIGYTIYQKYSPLAELANCGNNCIDYKKVIVVQYETSVPDIKITETDVEKLIMDVPIIIRNPSTKDTETVKIDFDVSMEGKHLTKGTIPAYELPAKQNTTILIKDVVIKYEELGDVLQKAAERHGAEMVREGKANISMTTDLLIYFPIELFSINIYTFTIPIQIESEVPVDMLKQNEEAKKQIEEKIRGTIKEVQEKIKGELPTPIPTLPSLPTSTPIPSLPITTPKQISPVNDSIFSFYPRTTTLIWEGVPSAMSYTVEIELYYPGLYYPQYTGWYAYQLVPNIKTNYYTFDFVGAQPGRWRVWAVDANGQESPKSNWWFFRYTI